MKIVVIGGSGLIGRNLVANLVRLRHEAVAASPSTGVNAVTGEGLAAALAGAEVVVDVANSPSFADDPVLEFFTASSRNLARAGAAAGVRHHVALSVVGTERMQESGYFRAKLAQEGIIRSSSIPFTIVRATQFFEFIAAIAQSGGHGREVRMPSAAFQPIAAADVSAALAGIVVAAPVGGMVELAGPERLPIADAVRRVLRAGGDARTVLADPAAPYFGTVLNDVSLTPGSRPLLGPTTLQAWLDRAVR